MKLLLVTSAALSVMGLASAASTNHYCKETYTVVSGDTCASIASKHDISKDNLAKYTKQVNTGFNCDEIKPGQVICLEPKNDASKRGQNEDQSNKTQTKETQAKKTQAKETQAKKTQAKETQAKKSQAKETEAKKNQAKETQSKKPQAKKTTTKSPSIAKCKKTYTVVSGDTCASIASKHSISKANLAKYTKKINTSFDCDEIKAGQVICLEPKETVSKRSVKEDKKSEPKKKTTTHKKPRKTTTVKKPKKTIVHPKKVKTTQKKVKTNEQEKKN
ncbi:unnamed protein product [Rhizopus stolonifer]